MSTMAEFLKEKQKCYVNHNSHIVENGNHHSNPNLNQNYECPISTPVQSHSKSKSHKFLAAFELPDYIEYESRSKKEKSESWNKSSKISNFRFSYDESKEVKKGLKMDSTNNSTLSLHISAFENSNKTVASDLFLNKESFKKNGPIKKQKDTNQIFVASSTFVIQNPFEFPRQQNDEVKDPEMSQYSASQRLLNSNELPRSIQQMTNRNMSTLSDLINADDTSPPSSQPQAAPPQYPYPSPSSQPTQFTPQQSFQSQSSSQGFYPQPSPQSSNIGPSPFYPSQPQQPQQQQQQFYSQYPQQSSYAPQQQEPIEIDDDEEYEPESPIEPPKPRTELDIALNGLNGDDPLPATPLMLCVDRLYQSFNNLILDFFPEAGLAVPQQSDIKESAEFNVKTFRDACQELTAEFTRSAVEWQLVNPQEYYVDEIKDLEKSIARQTEIQKRVEGKINSEISKPSNGDKPRRV